MKKLLLILMILSFVSKAQPPTYTATINNAPVGYYFVSVYKNVLVTYPIIFDERGNIVYYQKLLNSYSHDFKLHSNGLMSYYTSIDMYPLIDSTFVPIDTIHMIGYSTDTHELQILPNGHYLLLGYEYSTQDLSSYHYFSHSGAPGSSNASVKSNVIQELDENKNVVFEWHHKDHFPFDEVDPFFLSSPTSVDWSHSNALQLDNDSNILMSSRHFDEITKINRTTGDIMWHFGGNYNQFTFIGDSTPFYGQHDIRRLSNGHITFFDDANHTIPHAARAVEYELDEVNMTAKLVWSYIYDSAMYSTSQGSVQVELPSRNTLIDYGTTNKDTICFTMVDSLGNMLYKMQFNGNLISYRAHYYSSLPWQINRPTISCVDSAGTYYLKVDSAYSSYSWNTGASSQAIAITDTGSYYVFVPYGGLGGYVSSVLFKVNDLNNICGSPTSISQIYNGANYKIYPNPTQNQLTVSFPQPGKNTVPIVRDMCGKRIMLSGSMSYDNTTYTFDVSKLSAGMYLLSVKDKVLKFIKK